MAIAASRPAPHISRKYRLVAVLSKWTCPKRTLQGLRLGSAAAAATGCRGSPISWARTFAVPPGRTSRAGDSVPAKAWTASFTVPSPLRHTRRSQPRSAASRAIWPACPGESVTSSSTEPVDRANTASTSLARDSGVRLPEAGLNMHTALRNCTGPHTSTSGGRICPPRGRASD